MSTFKKAKDMFRLQKQAKQVKKELKNLHVEAESGGVRVVVSGEQTVVSIDIPADMPTDKASPLLIDALNRALKKAQVVSAERMQGIMGELGIGA